MTYAARIAALPRPIAICRDDTQHGRDYYTTAGLVDYQAQAETIAAAADAELSALRGRVEELELALINLCDAADDTKYPRHGPTWDRLWNTAVAARAAINKESA